MVLIKLRKLAFIFLITYCSFFNAQWQSDVRLTNAPFNSYTNPLYNNNRCISSSGDTVHVAWYDNRDGNYEIYYKRSLNTGLSWSADTRLTNDTSVSQNASEWVSGQFVHIVWEDYRDGNGEIYYKRSSDAGISWGADTRLTNNHPQLSVFPSICGSGLLVHIVWVDTRDGNGEIYYKRSSDGGVSWETDTRLTINPDPSRFPSVSASGQNVHVVWDDIRNINITDEIYYRHSTDGGISWDPERLLSLADQNPSRNPSVSVSGQILHVVWNDTRDGNNEIYYKLSTDNGLIWGMDTRLTFNSSNSLNPSISASGSALHLVWRDDRDGNYEIYYKRSTDNGQSWEPDLRLTVNSGFSRGSFCTASGAFVHVVWCDNRDGNYEIYYKRNPTGNLVGINNINSEIPKEFKLYQNYPNPFNPVTKIKFQLSNFANTKLVIYSVLGKVIAVLVNEVLKPGTYEIEWNASDYPSGVYYCILETGIYNEAIKLILLK
jgi:hypothetical protein